jgi:hypothetical protein
MASSSSRVSRIDKTLCTPMESAAAGPNWGGPARVAGQIEGSKHIALLDRVHTARAPARTASHRPGWHLRPRAEKQELR